MKSCKMLLIALVAVSVVSVLPACKKEGPAERAGKEIDRSVEKAGKELENAGKKLNRVIKEINK